MEIEVPSASAGKMIGGERLKRMKSSARLIPVGGSTDSQRQNWARSFHPGEFIATAVGAKRDDSDVPELHEQRAHLVD